MVSADHQLSQRRQCALLRLARSGLYYRPVGESAENLRFMDLIDKQFLETPWYGSRQMARYMQRQGHKCGRHRVRRLMRKMRLMPIYQTPNTSKKHPRHKVWPYLLKGLAITRRNQVWCVDISYIPPLGTMLRKALPGGGCVGAFCISSRSWTGSAARSWLGGCRTAWKQTSVLRL